jgi:hypothetical protein
MCTSDPVSQSPVYGDKAFSLVEVMAAMAAGLFVLAAALQAVVYFQREFGRQHEHLVQQQDVRLGLELFQQEIRLAGSGSFSVARPDVVEFTANVTGLMTSITAPTVTGLTTLTVEDGRGWPANKLVSVCWNERCERFTLARAGLRNLLTLVEPASWPIPAGASITVVNRIRYYSRPDERGIIRWLRQIDGGASVIAGHIAGFTLRYWDIQGRPTTDPNEVRRLLIEIALPGTSVIESREISLRT